MNLPRIIVGGTGSGVGKTTISCAIIAGMVDMGYTVQPFKAGPDYIDPGYLGAAAGRAARNLDVWLMGESVPGIMSGGAAVTVSGSAADMAVIEGVMGLYDGMDGLDDTASTFHVARLTKTPIILVVDARGSGRSVAATVLGFARFGAASLLAGVIINHTGSSRHGRMCREAIESMGFRVLGVIPRDMPVLESRHLGLVPVPEDGALQKRIRGIADAVRECLDMDGICEIAASAPPLPDYAEKPTLDAIATIGVALDGSFNFYYADMLDAFRRGGADIVFFSPETDDLLPEVDGLYMGGGFPEVRGAILERNGVMKKAIRKMAEGGAPVYAECGGLMYLARGIESGSDRFAMAGLYDADIRMTGRVTLNYTKGVMERGPLGVMPFRGHEFHYSEVYGLAADSALVQRLERGVGIINGRDGLLVHQSLASYGHLYLDEKAVESMIGICVKYSRK